MGKSKVTRSPETYTFGHSSTCFDSLCSLFTFAEFAPTFPRQPWPQSKLKGVTTQTILQLHMCLRPYNVFFNTIPLYETVSLLSPYSSSTAPGTRGPAGPFPPPLKHLLLREDIQSTKALLISLQNSGKRTFRGERSRWHRHTLSIPCCLSVAVFHGCVIADGCYAAPPSLHFCPGRHTPYTQDTYTWTWDTCTQVLHSILKTRKFHLCYMIN